MRTWRATLLVHRLATRWLLISGRRGTLLEYEIHVNDLCSIIVRCDAKRVSVEVRTYIVSMLRGGRTVLLRRLRRMAISVGVGGGGRLLVIGLAGVATTTAAAAIGGLLLMMHRTATKKGQCHGKAGVNRGEKAIAYGYCCCGG